MAAASVPSLRAPEGLTAPDRSNSLVIPPAPANARPVPAGKTRCLDRPPSYFATAQNANQNASEPASEKK